VPRFICWFWSYINCVCLFTYLHHFLPSLLICFLTDLSASSRISPFRFQAGGRRRQPNLPLVFLVHFMLWYILLWMHVCLCCVWFSFSVLSQEIGWEERLRNDLFCIGWDVKPQLNFTWLAVSRGLAQGNNVCLAEAWLVIGKLPDALELSIPVSSM